MLSGHRCCEFGDLSQDGGKRLAGSDLLREMGLRSIEERDLGESLLGGLQFLSFLIQRAPGSSVLPPYIGSDPREQRRTDEEGSDEEH